MQGEAKEEVRSRLDIEAVIGEYVQLKRAGRNWKGLSPFSEEKTPSFFVSPEKGIWHDFSSNQGGDVFSFVMQVEGLDFRGALEHLARKAGVDLSQYETKESLRGLGEKKKRLLMMHESAATFYQRNLLASEVAKSYVKSREFRRQVVHDFRLGYAPGSGHALRDFLTAKGYSQAELRDGGLLSARGQDMFRDRLMIPLMDAAGQVIGFTARLLADIPNAPKYLNTPQTLLYDKGRHVYALHLAKDAVRKTGTAIMVEGNLDVIASHQAGVKQVVATAGTAMTESHVKTLARLAGRIRLAFDADKAGVAATERAIPIAGKVGVELEVVSLPDGAKDPDELIRRDPALWQQAVEASKPAIEWVIDQYEHRFDLTSALGKRQLTTEALELLRTIDDPVEQEHYLKILGEKTETSEASLRSRMHQLSEAAGEERLRAIKHADLPARDNVRQDHLLALLCFENEIRDAAMVLSVDAFDGDDRRELFRYLVTHPAGIPSDHVPKELREIETYVKIVQLKAETRYGERSAAERFMEAAHLVQRIKQEHVKQKKAQLAGSLREAEDRHDEVEINRLRHELNDLIKEENTRGKETTQ